MTRKTNKADKAATNTLAASAFVRTGWVEVIHSDCGAMVTQGENGPSFEPSAEAVQAQIDDLAKTKAESFLAAIVNNDFSEFGEDFEEFVKEGRTEGLTSEQIAKNYAESDLHEFTVEYIGIQADGRIWMLDPKSGDRLGQAHLG